MEKFDVIVIGGGHAGIEASLAASRMGCKTLLVTFTIESIGEMSCNPAIGGLGKGQLVREIDALGGEMGKAIDEIGIQFRQLNTSKGPAVRSSRAQADRQNYRKRMQAVVLNQPNLSVMAGQVKKLLVRDNVVEGVELETGAKILSGTVVVAPGTFFNGLIHLGLEHWQGGRLGDRPSTDLPENLKSLGFVLGRFKTGTCPRLNGKTIDFSVMAEQPGDNPAKPFSFSTEKFEPRQIPCFITRTTPATHRIIRENLDRSPLYTGIIKATGVRYCPSIEDKVVRFADKEQHHIFLEPEGIATDQYYPNGLSTSLPLDVQVKMIRSIPGLENAEIIRHGYGIEHDYVDPVQIFPTLETKLVRNLFLAGQINGTTGYEEAAAQGLVAGINAALHVQGREQMILRRSESYIGVLIDDLTTKGTSEPYRMFTSRVEYRLILREDNADLRLSEKGWKIGLVSGRQYEKINRKKQHIEETIMRLGTARISPTPAINRRLADLGTGKLHKQISAEELLRRPEITYARVRGIAGCPELSPEETAQVEIEVKYKSFIARQKEDVEKFRQMEDTVIPESFDYDRLSGLSFEVREKLRKFRPVSLGQAARISGITPAAISILMIYLKKIK